MTDDLLAFLHQQLENQRFRGESLKTLAYAMPAAETSAYLTETGEILLAEVDAKRRILDVYQADVIDVSRCGGPPEWMHGAVPVEAHIVLRLLALPYAGREGYRSEWAP